MKMNFMNEDVNSTDLTLQSLSDLTQERVFANMALRALDSHKVWSVYVLERINSYDKACEGLLKCFNFACMLHACLPWMRICHCFAV